MRGFLERKTRLLYKLLAQPAITELDPTSVTGLPRYPSVACLEDENDPTDMTFLAAHTVQFRKLDINFRVILTKPLPAAN